MIFPDPDRGGPSSATFMTLSRIPARRSVTRRHAWILTGWVVIHRDRWVALFSSPDVVPPSNERFCKARLKDAKAKT